MGLVTGFVLAGNRRALLATFAITVSVTYTLIAAATVAGLRQAQEELSADLQAPQYLVFRRNLEPFESLALPSSPDAALAVLRAPEATYYVARVGEGRVENASQVALGPSTGYAAGSVAHVLGLNRTVVAHPSLGGIATDWMGVDEATFASLGGVAAPLVHVASFTRMGEEAQAAVRAAGYELVEAPATKAFYEAGTGQLVSAVWTTVLASTAVVAVVTGGFLLLELQALHRSFATLRMFAGLRIVAGLVVLRGVAMLAAGHLLAIGGTKGLLFFLRAADVFTFSLPWEHVWRAAALTMGGGLLGTLPALLALRRPLQSAQLRGRHIRPGTPRVLRFALASRRSVIPLAAAATVLAATLGVVFGTLALPSQIFGQFEGEEVISAKAQGNPLRTTVSAFVGLHLDEVEGIEAASPEIFAPTSLKGRPVMLRGVSWPDFDKLERPRIVDGAPPQGPADAVAGARLARMAGLHVGDDLVVPSSYHPSVTLLRVVGIADVRGILQDEVFVSLPTARSMTALGPDDVNLIRFRAAAGTPSLDDGTVAGPTAIEVVDLRVTPAKPVAYETASVAVDLVNFSPVERTRTLTLRVNGLPTADLPVTMAPHSARTEQLEFRVPPDARLTLQINPTVELTPGAPSYKIEAPDRAAVGSNLDVRVLDLEQRPAAGVTVRFLDANGTTDDQGRTAFSARSVGNHTLLAEGPEGRAARPVLVMEAQDFQRPRLRLRDIVGPTEMAQGTWRGTVELENVGGVEFNGPLPITVDGNATQLFQISLPSGRTLRTAIQVDLAPGRHRIGDANASLEVNVAVPSDSTTAPGYETGSPQPTDGPGPEGEAQPSEVEELLKARRAGLGQGVSQGRDPEEAFLGDTYANLDVAVTLVTIATVLHSGLVVFATVQREIEERSANVGTLAFIGADRRALRQQALREYATLGTVAAVVGTAAGLGITGLATYLGLLNGFGHALQPRIGLDFAIRLATVSVLTILAAALIAVEHARTRNLRQLLSQGPSRRDRPNLDLLLQGRP